MMKRAHDNKFDLFLSSKRIKQADYVVRKLDEMKNNSTYSLLNELDKEKFEKTVGRLLSNWTGKNCLIGDCEGKRIVNKFARSDLKDSIFMAIVTDNKEKFFSVVDLNSISTEVVNFVFISGAKSIASELFKHEEIISQSSKELIAYAVSSGNKELALLTAGYFKEKGEVDPGMIYSYSFGKISIVEAVDNLFNSDNLTKLSC